MYEDNVDVKMGRYEIAGLKVDMAVFGRTARQAAAYASDCPGEADITIRCDARKILERSPRLESEDVAEYVCTGILFARRLPEFGGLQLHASAVILDGRAYLFSAPSGVGKSTHTEKWRRLFGAAYLNDDKPVLRLQPEGWMVYGTPWSGKYDLSAPKGVPLGGIAFVWRSEENRMVRLEPGEALPMLMAQTTRSLKKTQMERLLPLVDQLLRQEPCWQLFCRDDDDAALLSHRMMTAQEAGSCGA